MSDVTAQQVVDAFAAHGKEALYVINEDSPKTSGKGSNMVRYFKMQLKLADGSTVRSYLKTTGLKVSGVRDPDQRGDMGPTFTYNLDAVSKTGEPVGEATRLLCDAWIDIIQDLKTKGIIDEDEKVNKPYKVDYKDKETGKKVSMDKPLYRVKLRKMGRDNPLLRCDISYVKKDDKGELVRDAQGNVKQFDTYESESFSEDNIHHVLKSGSIIIGLINLGEFNVSGQGVSLSNSAVNLIIRSGTGSSLSAEATHGANAANLLDNFGDDEPPADKVEAAAPTADDDPNYEGELSGSESGSEDA